MSKLIDNPNSGASIGSPLSGGTANSVLFIGPTGLLAQDNTNFSYVSGASFKAYGIQNDISNYAYGDFQVNSNGNYLIIDDASNIFDFGNTNNAGRVDLQASSFSNL